MVSFGEKLAAAQQKYIQAKAAAAQVVNEVVNEVCAGPPWLTREAFEALKARLEAAQAAEAAASLAFQRVLDEDYAEWITRRQRPPKPPNVG